jgi:DNA-3-methyladenine glycosylase II
MARWRSATALGMNIKSTKQRVERLRPMIEARLTTADPALGRLIAAVANRVGRQQIAPSRTTPFEALVRAVVYQSVSGKAAASIFAHLQEVVGRTLTPSRVMARSPQSLARAGLSRSKVRTIRSLADRFTADPKLARRLPTLSDDEIVETLRDIPGVGTWTINVFLIFDLGREDVMPTADLGIRRGLQLIDGSRSAPTAKRVAERSKQWSPYRSIASIYLWQAGKLRLGPKDLKGVK